MAKRGILLSPVWNDFYISLGGEGGGDGFNNENIQRAIANNEYLKTKCHFDAWAKQGLNLGTLDYQVLATEGWGSAGGSSNYTITG